MNKPEEYISLRSEIISLIEIQNNYIIAMYTITIALITLAIQQKNVWLYLLPYIILFSFQRIISAKKDVMLRIAAYIAVFLDGNLGWEKNYKNIINNTLKKYDEEEKFSKLKNILSGRISSLQLGAVCSVGCILMQVIYIFKKNKWTHLNEFIWQKINFIDMLPIICAILLFCILADWCSGALNSMSVREKYIESLTNYKRKVNSTLNK